MHRLGRLGEGALSTPATRCPGWTGNGSSQATFVPDPPDVWGSVLEGRSSDLSRVTWIGCWDSSLGLNPKLLGGGPRRAKPRAPDTRTTRRRAETALLGPPCDALPVPCPRPLFPHPSDPSAIKVKVATVSFQTSEVGRGQEGPDI